MAGLVVPFTLFTVLYLFLGVIVVWLLRAQILQTRPDPAHPIRRDV